VLKRRKVIWKEGMFLQPQHFQQADRFFEQALAAQWMYGNPYFFGLTQSVIDSTALASGVVTLTSCSGIFPDGTVFSIPKEDDAPASRAFADHFSHDQQSCDVFLALPLPLEGKATVAAEASGVDESGSAGRYRIQTCPIIDEVSGSQKKQIDVGAYNFALLFSGESLDNYTTLQIARLKRKPNGQIELQDDYIPPLAQIGGSHYLLNQLRSLLELLLAKSTALSQGRKEGIGGKATFSSAEEGSFRLLEAINTYAPMINYYHFEPRVHPFELFKLLTQCAGALTAFSAEVSLRDLKRYDHENLAGTFGGLIGMIRKVIEADLDTGCVAVPLDQIDQATYVGKLPNDRLLTTAKFYLGVSARIPEKELIIGVAQRIKMSSRDRLDLLISSAMPGLPLIHTAHPPEDLSTKPGFLYFAFDQQSQFWRGMQSAGSIAFYFPNNYPELKVELLALRH
jgi:type VI secretion system protein ImpJ